MWRAENLMVLLLKVSAPSSARDTRPIATGCAAEKIYSSIILERSKPHRSIRRPWQCCAPARQKCDYLHAIHRLFQSEREGQCGLAVLKIDFAKAFDSVCRQKLLGKLFQNRGIVKSTGRGRTS